MAPDDAAERRHGTVSVSAAELASRIHFSGRRFSPITNISMRIIIALLALAFTTLIVYLERDCYADRGQTGTLSPLDALYYATVSLSTTGYGDIVPVCPSSRLANVLLITPLRFVFLIVLVGTTIEVLTRRTREEWRADRWRKHVNDHKIGRASCRERVYSNV